MLFDEGSDLTSFANARTVAQKEPLPLLRRQQRPFELLHRVQHALQL
jgi:hypothetical protein